MHLCIPDYELKENDGVIVPSKCSYNALSIFWNERSRQTYPYHFPIHEINVLPSTIVLIRNLPPGFHLYSNEGTKLSNLIKSICEAKSIKQVNAQFSLKEGVKVIVSSASEASKLAEVLNSCIDGEYLVMVGMGKEEDEKEYSDFWMFPAV